MFINGAPWSLPKEEAANFHSSLPKVHARCRRRTRTPPTDYEDSLAPPRSSVHHYGPTDSASYSPLRKFCRACSPGITVVVRLENGRQRKQQSLHICKGWAPLVKHCRVGAQWVNRGAFGAPLNTSRDNRRYRPFGASRTAEGQHM